MISLATDKDRPILKKMWKTVFDDTDSFIALLFSKKYKAENTLIYTFEGKIVASLQMFPYEFTFWGETITCYYLAGLCTLAPYRRKGIMPQLIFQSNRLMVEREIPLALLIPADADLYQYYKQFDYEHVFEKDNLEIPLTEILDKSESLESAYEKFNEIYRKKDFCIQKTFADFEAIITDSFYDGFFKRTNISGMAQLIDTQLMFDIYLKKSKNNIALNLVKKEIIEFSNNVLSTNKRNLCRLLFGYKTSELDAELSRLFPEHHPILNLMLE